MESVSRGESVEGIESWRELREQAPEKAKEIIAGISGFENMDAFEQCAVLQREIDILLKVKDQKDRYLTKELDRNMLLIRERNEHNNRMRSLAA